MVIINNVACNTFKMMIFSLCCFASDMSDERRFFFFFPSNFFHFCHLSFCRVCLFFFFSNIKSFRKKDTKEREIPLLSLFSLLSQKSLSLSFSLSSVVKFLFDEREREKEVRVPFFVFFARVQRERGKEIAIRLTPD